MGRSSRRARTWMAPFRSASPASLELRFEHNRSPEPASRIEPLPAGSEDPDGSG